MKTPTEKWRKQVLSNMKKSGTDALGLWRAMERVSHVCAYTTVWRSLKGYIKPNIDIAVAMRDVSKCLAEGVNPRPPPPDPKVPEYNQTQEEEEEPPEPDLPLATLVGRNPEE